jgi:diguanylate cyclase (GGDEF)-like protein/PAS domain S-box-containing protein
VLDAHQGEHGTAQRGHARRVLSHVNLSGWARADTDPVRKRMAAAIMEEWPDVLVIADARGRIEYVNRAFEALTGYRRSEVLGQTPAMLSSGRHDRAFYRRLWRRLSRGEAYRGIFVNRGKDGRLFHEEEIIRPLRGADGRIERFVCAGRDVSALVREMQKLRNAATHDPLTGLPNVALFADRLAQALRDAERRSEGLVVALLDLDDFKRINTRYGHLGGDAVLKAVARRTRRAIRAIDTVARVGGDEFALVLPGVRSKAAAGALLEKIRAANRRAVPIGRRRIAVSVSVGAAIYPGRARTGKALRALSDAAMYAAKAAGGDCWRFA